MTTNFVPSWGGTTVSVRNFQGALGSHVISFTGENAICEAIRGDRVFHVPTRVGGVLGGYGWASRSALAGAAEIARECDVVFCHMLFRYHNQWALEIAEQVRVPLCIVPHGALDPYVLSYRGWQKRAWVEVIGRRYFKKAGAVIFASESEQEKAIFGLGGNVSTVVHWPVDVLNVDSENRRCGRAALGIGSEDRVLLYMGRLQSMKRPVETIRAFAASNARNCHLVVVGPEEEYTLDQLREVARESGGRRIGVYGPMYGEDKKNLLAAVDGYISLSIRENFGYAAAEAMGCGIPVIMSRGNALHRAVERVGAGWIVEGDQEDEIREAIRQFSESRYDSLKIMGSAGRRWIQAFCGRDEFNRRVLSVAGALVR